MRRLLQPAAHRGDALRVEAEPVHAADVARVLDLEAAIHDHRHAARLGDARAFLVDHAELAPEACRRRSRRLRRRSPGSASGARKTLTMSTGTGTSSEARDSSSRRGSPSRAGSPESRGSRGASGSSRRSSWRAARSTTARRSRRSSRCGARAGSSADPGSASDRTGPARPRCSCRRRHAREALLEIPDQIVDRLGADREPDRARADARRPQLVVAQLAVRRAGGMDDQALRVADVRQVRPERDAADEVLARRRGRPGSRTRTRRRRRAAGTCRRAGDSGSSGRPG